MAIASLLSGAAIWGYFFLLPFETAPDLATFFLVAFGLLALYLDKGLSAPLERVDYSLIAIILLAVGGSTALSSLPQEGLGYSVYMLVNLFLLLLVAGLDRRYAAKSIALAVSIFGVAHLVALLTAGQATGQAGANAIVDQAGLATLVVPNDAIILGLCLPSLVYISPQGGRWRGLAILGLAAYLVLSVFVCHQLQSKVALLSVLAAAVLMPAARLLLRRREKVQLNPLAALGSLAAGLLSFAGLAFYLGNQSTTRLSLWMEAATAHDSFREMLFGLGPNSFFYNPTAVEPVFDRGDLVIPWVHNLYLEAWHDLGLVGLVAFIGLTLVPVLRALRTRDRNAGALVLVSMVVFILAAMLEITLTRRFFFAFLAAFYGLALSQALESNHER